MKAASTTSSKHSRAIRAFMDAISGAGRTAILGVVAVVLASVAAHSNAQQGSGAGTYDIPARQVLPPSYCPNISTDWYNPATQELPPAGPGAPNGYYKSTQGATAGTCQPIPTCPAGTAWNAGAESCQSICTGGQVWNGSSCACPAGSNWSTASNSCVTCPSGTFWSGAAQACVTPPTITSFSVTPTSAAVGGSYTATWSATGTGALSSALVCTGANPASFSVAGGNGSRSWPVTAVGATNCTLTVTGPHGSPASSNVALSASCPSGQVLAGGVCGAPPSIGSFSVGPASVTTGGAYTTSWSASGSGTLSASMSCTGANAGNFSLTPAAGGTGSLPAPNAGTTNCTMTVTSAFGTASRAAAAVASTCPAGQTQVGSACVAPPSSVGLTISPSSVNVGGSQTYSWSANNSPTSATLNCTGANPRTVGLSPASSGSISLTASAAGTSNCQVVATNAAGSGGSVVVAASAVCPGGTIWNGSSCAVAGPQAILAGKTITVYGYSGFGTLREFLVLTGTQTGIRVTYRGGYYPRECTLAAAGQVCSSGEWTYYADGVTANAEHWYWVHQQTGYGPYAHGGDSAGRLYVVRLNADGSLTFYEYGSGSSFDFARSTHNAYRESNMGTMTADQARSICSGCSFNLPRANSLVQRF